MKALVTGASSGIGRSVAIYLSKLGYDLIVVARREEPLIKLKLELKTDVEIILKDLSNVQNCIELYEQVKNEDIDILVNNAGFGAFGEFTEIELEKEINMLNTNILAVHTLTKLFLKDMVKKDKGYILNVSSVASFMPGPLMAAYYASKAYVTRHAEAVAMELKKKKSNVYVGVLCPGPVDTNFNDVAGVKFSIKPLSSEYVAKYAVRKMLKRKLIIVPGLFTKLTRFFAKIVPDKVIANVAYANQGRKEK